MLESTSILVNKLCLRITKGNDASEDMGVGDIVLTMMYKQISEVFNILFDWRTFSQGGTFITTDNRVRGIIQTAQIRDEHMLWAARLGVKDDSFQRRRFLAFTKKYELIDDYINSHGSLPENLIIVLSAWGEFKPANPHNLPVAYIRFKKETTGIPADARPCPSYCGDCVATGMSCWDLKRRESVVFNEH